MRSIHKRAAGIGQGWIRKSGNTRQKKACSPELGVYLSDLLINCERVSDHCSNVAVSIIQISMSSMNIHDYLSGLKAGRSPQFIDSYMPYGQKYRLAAANSAGADATGAMG